MFKLTYLDGITGCLLPEPNGIARNAQHGTEGSEPSEAMSPPWELIVQIFNWSPLNNVEDENSLKLKILIKFSQMLLF